MPSDSGFRNSSTTATPPIGEAQVNDQNACIHISEAAREIPAMAVRAAFIVSHTVL